MKTRRLLVTALILVTLALPLQASAQQPDPDALLTAQREAMRPLAFMDGVWRGPANTVLPNGEKHDITQTERIGPLLDGSIKVIEGRGYDAGGKTVFNAFGIVSFNPATKTYNFHSYAMGMSGDFAFKPSSSGYVWEIPAGPMTIRYTAEIKDGTWHEVGDRIMPGQPAVRFFEMTLQRIGDSDWPASGAIPRK